MASLHDSLQCAGLEEDVIELRNRFDANQSELEKYLHLEIRNSMIANHDLCLKFFLDKHDECITEMDLIWFKLFLFESMSFLSSLKCTRILWSYIAQKMIDSEKEKCDAAYEIMTISLITCNAETFEYFLQQFIQLHENNPKLLGQKLSRTTLLILNFDISPNPTILFSLFRHAASVIFAENLKEIQFPLLISYCFAHFLVGEILEEKQNVLKILRVFGVNFWVTNIFEDIVHSLTFRKQYALSEEGKRDVDALINFITSLMKTPLTLQELTRLRIMHSVGTDYISKLNLLEPLLPNDIFKFLRFNDLKDKILSD